MHFPVLKKEVLHYLNPRENENFIDCTFGEGGHSLAILEENKPRGKVLGIERDQQVCKKFKEINSRLALVNDSYTNLEHIVKEKNFKEVKGILFDFGMSSWHLEESKRGFSFQRNEKLDMRYNLENDLTCWEIINNWSQEEIKSTLKDYGEERFAERIAKRIILEREKEEIKTTFQLAEIIRKSVPYKYKSRINFATRVFQALRIAVNNELENVSEGLEQALRIVKGDGIITAISFHSLEDRIVKHFFKNKAKENLVEILTKKPIIAEEEEIKINPRSRSAKLRAIKKINN